jgi:hypothetical protein
MALIPVPQEQHKDRKLHEQMTRVIQLLSAVAAIPILDGVWVRKVTINTALTKVKHGLARLPRGFIVTTMNPGDVIREDTTLRTKTDMQLGTASGTIIADLWVF